MGRISMNVGHVGKHNGGWKGGISIKWAHRCKKKVCEECGAKKNLQVHHKDKNPKNNTAENLRTLCIPCHRKTHSAEMQICKRCNKKFTGPSNAKRCIPCRKEHGCEYRRQYYQNYDRTKPKGERKYAA